VRKEGRKRGRKKRKDSRKIGVRGNFTSFLIGYAGRKGRMKK
jgi:hypothetical protein